MSRPIELRLGTDELVALANRLTRAAGAIQLGNRAIGLVERVRTRPALLRDDAHFMALYVPTACATAAKRMKAALRRDGWRWNASGEMRWHETLAKRRAPLTLPRGDAALILEIVEAQIGVAHRDGAPRDIEYASIVSAALKLRGALSRRPGRHVPRRHAIEAWEQLLRERTTAHPLLNAADSLGVDPRAMVTRLAAYLRIYVEQQRLDRLLAPPSSGSVLQISE